MGRLPTNWFAVEDFGQVPDRVIAKRLGVSEGAVRYQRRLRDIEPYAPHKRAKGIDWDSVDNLGEVPDDMVAWQQECSETAVRRARQARGILASTYR